ncbi:DUF1774-domain-containing protein [Westerdykella ornata]|uniref:DUF1774-domain-containing protein n=1 Tax=Westerdykella ornata TaxID=318751 RepID=A0A6A6JI01_WESOR|nr:DUF1774-domain-containing protein [Westerdykella ornata]KAF2275713.1 DUF1774-domain-containing protein [Westerdykella ornata]
MANSLLAAVNPFARRDEYSRNTLNVYRVTTLVSYLVLVVTAFYYTFNKPHEGHHPHKKIWGNNRPTPFAQNSIITSVYWLILFLLQALSTLSLFTSNPTHRHATASIAPHTTLSNLLLFAFIHLWTRSHFLLSLLLLAVNFANLSAAYFRHSTTPRFIHWGSVSGPLAWNFVALYWVGAVAVHNTNHLAARIVANVFIWGFLGYGLFFLVAFKDYTMGFNLSVLSFSTAVGQLLTKPHLFQLQWIFAFTIGAILFVLSVLVAAPGLIGREDLFVRGQVVSEDRERAPLLANE